jgi:hypothetical protein
MSVPQGSSPSEVTVRTKLWPSCQRTVRMVMAALLTFAFLLTNAPAALAGPACPDKPGVCAPTQLP